MPELSVSKLRSIVKNADKSELQLDKTLALITSSNLKTYINLIDITLPTINRLEISKTVAAINKNIWGSIDFSFDSIAKIALANNKSIISNLDPINKTILSIHKNLANNLSNKSWNTLFQNLGNLTADINFSDVNIESQGDTLIINDEVITEESIHDFTETLSNTKENAVEIWTNTPKSLKIFLALLAIYFTWFVDGFLDEIPKNNIFHPKIYFDMLFSKPTMIQQKLIKQIKLKQTTAPQYIVNRQLMPVYLYANRKSPIVSYLFCGNEVKIIKSIKKKRWLFIDWTCDEGKESGWVLGRYILKTSSKKTAKEEK